MRKLFLVLPFTIFLAVAFGQVDSNSITVTASRNVTSGQPDQAVFSIQVNSSLDTTLGDVIAALQGSGITVANFSRLNSVLSFNSPPAMQPPPMLSWSFQFAAPITKTKDTVTMLSAVQQNIAKKNSGLTMFFSVQGTQVSAQSQQMCSLTDLVADACVRAQKVADAGGVSVGNILAMFSASLNGGFSYGQVASLDLFAVPASSGGSCALTVKFALVRF